MKLNTWKYELGEWLNEIIELNHRIEGNGIYVFDIVHVFEANNPASQLVSGQEKLDITFGGNSQNIAHTCLHETYLLLIVYKKYCKTNATTKKVQENKLKLYKNLKSLVQELLKRNINFTCNSEIQFLKNVLDMEMHGRKWLTALSFDNLEKTLKILVWKYMKFYTMTYYITSSTARKKFTMNCINTSLKHKKEFKQFYSCIVHSKKSK